MFNSLIRRGRTTQPASKRANLATWSIFEMGSSPYIKIISSVMLFFCTQAFAREEKLKVYYKDDFILASPNEEFQLKIGGSVHFDFRGYQAEQRGAPYSFDIRRARIDLQGKIHRWFTFRIQPEIAGSPYIRNAWFDVGMFSWLNIRVGQMKVPFSSSWVTFDNNVNFIERATDTPLYPFFDRGVLIWGGLWNDTIIYNLGAYTGAGIDVDNADSDIDDSKDVAGRIFCQPFRLSDLNALKGIYVVGQTTWGKMSVPTSRFETGGLRSPNYETAIWRWRTEQTIGTDGRVIDSVKGEIESRLRWGAELHYLLGPFTFSSEYLEVRYKDISIYHDLMNGSTRLVHEQLFKQSGTIRSLSAFISFYLTGEQKELTNWGWKTPKPKKSIGEGGVGAIEILGRYSRTWTDKELFEKQNVSGLFSTSTLLPSDYQGATPGANNEISVSILDGANDVHEFTLGFVWTINPMVRLQLNDVFLWAPELDRNNDGKNDNQLVSGAKSNQSNPLTKNAKTKWENAIMGRVIFKI